MPKEKSKDKKSKGILKNLSKQLSNKKILNKGKQATLVLKESKPAEYVSRFFKDEFKEAQRSMYLEWYSIRDF